VRFVRGGVLPRLRRAAFGWPVFGGERVGVLPLASAAIAACNRPAGNGVGSNERADKSGRYLSADTTEAVAVWPTC